VSEETALKQNGISQVQAAHSLTCAFGEIVEQDDIEEWQAALLSAPIDIFLPTHTHDDVGYVFVDGPETRFQVDKPVP
jgi:hypothetical protein